VPARPAPICEWPIPERAWGSQPYSDHLLIRIGSVPCESSAAVSAFQTYSLSKKQAHSACRPCETHRGPINPHSTRPDICLVLRGEIVITLDFLRQPITRSASPPKILPNPSPAPETIYMYRCYIGRRAPSAVPLIGNLSEMAIGQEPGQPVWRSEAAARCWRREDAWACIKCITSGAMIRL
jgi:hypothetical protein